MHVDMLDIIPIASYNILMIQAQLNKLTLIMHSLQKYKYHYVYKWCIM